MWSLYQTVNNTVADVMFDHRVDKLMEFEASLKRCREDFLLPLNNPCKSDVDRQSIRKANVEAISIPSLSQKILLTHDLIDETLTLSDVFDLNEITALELVLTAEGHVSSQTCELGRGPLAITLYFDAHRALSSALKFVMQCRKGRIPRINAMPQQVSDVVNSFTEDLWQSGLLNNILSFLAKFNIEEELRRLNGLLTLGNNHHHRDILRLLTEIRNCYAECVMLWSAQSPLSSSEINQIITHLVTIKLVPVEACDQQVMPMSLDHASIHLVIALLSSLDPFGAPGVNIDQFSEAVELDLLHPIFSEVGYIDSVTSLLAQANLTEQQISPTVQSFYGLLQLAWGVALRRSAHLRMDLRRRGEDVCAANITPQVDMVDEDELVTSSLRSRCLEFLSAGVLSETHFPQEPQWVQQVHYLLTDFLVNFPQNARDIRLWDESVARRIGVDPGNFAILLDTVGHLYNVPGSKLHARLSLEYWWRAGEVRSSQDTDTTLNASFTTTEADSSRQAVLFRFVYSASEFASASSIFVSYVRMLRSLVGCQTSANFCFNLLKTTASTGGRLASILTWEHFIRSLHQYLDHLKRAATAAQLHGAVNQPLHLQHPQLYQSAAGDQLQTAEQLQLNPPPLQLEIQPEELEALRVVVALITRICTMDPIARSAFAANTKWRLIPTTIGLITCPLPIYMKADLLHLLSALSLTPAIGFDVWCGLVDSRLLAFVEPSSTLVASSGLLGLQNAVGLHTEMDKLEPRLEEYPITQAFISLLTTLAPSLLNSVTASTASEPEPLSANVCDTLSRLVHFTLDTIFLKHTMRAYRRTNERWEVAASCVILFEGLVRVFLRRVRSVAILLAGANQCSDSQLALFDWAALLNGQMNPAKLNLPRGWPFTDPGYKIITQLLTNSSLFSLLTSLLEIGLYRLLEYSTNAPSCAMVRATAAILRLFEHVLPHEHIVVNLVRRAALVVPHLRSETVFGKKPGTDVILPTPLSRLLVVTINSRSGRADLLFTIVQYCSLADDLPDHCASALNILCSVVRVVQPHGSVLSVFTNDKKSEQNLLRALVSCFSTSRECITGSNKINTDPVFSDAWLYANGDGETVDADNLHSRCALRPHPALEVARMCAALPTIPSDWDLTDIRWETMNAFPLSTLEVPETWDTGDIGFLRHRVHGHGSSVRSMMLHLILYALTHHQGPSIAHWLLGFRCQSNSSIAITTLQDAGVGGFPRTCLHGILDLIELSAASLRESGLGDFDQCPPHPSLLAQQWDAAIGWQILYYLMTTPKTTGVPISRYLRGNHDLLARHLTTGLLNALLVSPPTPVTNSAAVALQSLVLNQCSWLMKMVAIELQSSTSQRTYLTRLLTILFAIKADSPAAEDIVFSLGRGTSIEGLSLLNPQTDSTPKSQILSGILSSMAPSDVISSPQWIFDHDCPESKLLEGIVISCEEPFPLIPFDEKATLRSGVINTDSLACRLSVFFGDASDCMSPSLVNNVSTWARHRNAHRLCLVAGKQACLEGWRHLAEIGIRMLHFFARANPDALSLTSASSKATVSVNQHLYACAISLTTSLLQEVSAPERVPAVLKVLASGSCLSLTGFLQIFASPSSADSTNWCVMKTRSVQNILSVAQLLTKAVLSSKPAQQRVRANYYGAMCYVLDVCQQMDQLMTALEADATGLSLSAQAINILSCGDDDILFNGRLKSGGSSRNSFFAILFADISSAHHPIVPISALGLVCLLLKIDRFSGYILDILIREGCLQLCVDSLEDDLVFLQQYLLSRTDASEISRKTSGETYSQQELTDATSVFYVYQSKMALLTLIATTHLGAKLLIQSNLLDTSLSRFEPFSASCLADAMNMCVSAANGYSASEKPFDSLSWLDSHEFVVHLLAILNQQKFGEFFDYPSGVVEPLITSQLLSVCGSIPEASVDLGHSLSWIGIFAPALAFARALVYTLGPTHVAGVQKVSKFIYTHSDALFTVGASTTATLLVTTIMQECFQEDKIGEKQEQLVVAALQWLQGEESLAHIIAFILRSRIPCSLTEPGDLPRELLRSKALRHIFAILPGLLQSLQTKERRSVNVSGSPCPRQMFQRNLVMTQKLELLRVLVSTCAAVVSTEDEFSNFDATLLKNLIFSASLSPDSSDSDSTGDSSALTVTPFRPSLHLVLQLVSWSASRLNHIETIMNAASRHLPSSLTTVSNRSVLKEGSPEDNRECENLPMNKLLERLIQLPIIIVNPGEEVSTDSLCQIATSIFSVWYPVSGQLLQTLSASGVDISQRNAYLRRFVAVGSGLLQKQLTHLIDILEQSLYLLWRHLTYFISFGSRQDVLAEAGLDGCITNTPHRSKQPPESDLLEQLHRRLSLDLLDSITQISKAPYLSSHDQLFLQVMVQRLDRISQTRTVTSRSV